MPSGSNSEVGYQLRAAFGVQRWSTGNWYARPEVLLQQARERRSGGVVEPGLFGAIVSVGIEYRLEGPPGP